jgi:hypothetical protein
VDLRQQNTTKFTKPTNKESGEKVMKQNFQINYQQLLFSLSDHKKLIFPQQMHIFPAVHIKAGMKIYHDIQNVMQGYLGINIIKNWLVIA